jgi:hypothetical protein
MDLLNVLSGLGERNFFLTSAKTGEQVEAAFDHLANNLEEGM